MLQIPAFCAILGVPMNQSIISFVLINKRSLNCSEKKKLEEGSGKIEYS